MRTPTEFVRTASPEALFIIAGISQYTGAVVAVNLFEEVRPATVAWFRVLFAALTLIAVSWRQVRGRWTRAELKGAAFFGVATAFMNLFFYLAIDRLPLGKSVVMEFIGPIAVAAAYTRNARNSAALVLAAIGVATLSGVELGGEPWGIVFILSASALWARYIILGRRVAQLDRGMAGLGVGLAIGSLAILPFGVAGSGKVFGDGRLLLMCVVIGALSSAIAYGIDQVVLRRIPVRRFAVLLALLPVSAMILGYIALSQTPSALDLLGAALVIAGVLIQEREELTSPIEEVPV
ncbi:MAG TPA: EamA family transporter [Ilumatobacteraceae bacterium]|nr:EamA family transporter [Ilumatobacteraceae bacterium]HRB02001.1 EamA family transporter [Ilumatobacteraceae bacterium]